MCIRVYMYVYLYIHFKSHIYFIILLLFFFFHVVKSNDPKGTIQKIKKIDLNKIPRNVTDFLVFNKVGTKEEVKILFGLKAIKINGNTSTK